MSARARVAMAPAEVDSFLAERTTMTVATLGADGRPHLVAMWYVIRDGLPVFWTFAKSQKAVNIRRDPRLTCLVEAGEEYSQLRGVEIVGDAEVTDRYDEVREVGLAIAARYADRMDASALAEIDAQALRRVAVVVRPTSIVSWDHRKLGR